MFSSSDHADILHRVPRPAQPAGLGATAWGAGVGWGVFVTGLPEHVESLPPHRPSRAGNAIP